MNWLGTILAIGALIVVHEAGHYFVARWCGMRVERFSIGFGPALAGWVSKKTGTKFQLAPIPFGGFVEIKGMNILEEIDPDDATAYPNRPVWQRFATIFAGPATNYLFAIVLAFVLFAGAGLQKRLPAHWVNETTEGMPAHGVLEPGDRIVAVDGEEIGTTKIQEVVKRVGDREAVWTVERGGERVDVTIRPRYNEKDDAYQLGFRPESRVIREPVGPLTAAKEAIAYPFVETKNIVTGLYMWATGQVKGEVSGVVGIAVVVKKAFDEGWVAVVGLLMVLNVYLGLFNLFPLPALDGGRLVFLGYEMVTRRRANPKLEATIHMVGVLALAVLLVVVLVKDIQRL